MLIISILFFCIWLISLSVKCQVMWKWCITIIMLRLQIIYLIQPTDQNQKISFHFHQMWQSECLTSVFEKLVKQFLKYVKRKYFHSCRLISLSFSAQNWYISHTCSSFHGLNYKTLHFGLKRSHLNVLWTTRVQIKTCDIGVFKPEL